MSKLILITNPGSASRKYALYDGETLLANLHFEYEGKKVVCIVSGGNIDVNILSRVITRGLVKTGRNATLTIELEDKPGQLVGVSTIISNCGGNVVSVLHERSDANVAVASCYLKVGMETRDFAQIEEIRSELTKAGFKIV